MGKLSRTLALSEVQIWIPQPESPRYEAEDSLMGSFIGGFEGRFADGNVKLVRPSYAAARPSISTDFDTGIEGEGQGDMPVDHTDGGAVIRLDGWIEWAGIEHLDTSSTSAMENITVIGVGMGSVIVGINFLKNVTVELTGAASLPLSESEDEVMAMSSRDSREAQTGEAYVADATKREREKKLLGPFEFLPGGIMVTLWSEGGLPFVDAIEIG